MEPLIHFAFKTDGEGESCHGASPLFLSSHYTRNPQAIDLKIISGKNRSSRILAQEKHAYFMRAGHVADDKRVIGVPGETGHKEVAWKYGKEVQILQKKFF